MGFGIANESGRGQWLARSAESMLRALGGDTVQLRLGGAVDGSLNAELGATPQSVQEIEITPVAVRGATPAAEGSCRFELLLPASLVNAEAERNGLASGGALIEGAAGIVVQGTTMCVEKIMTESFGDIPYLYRVIVKDQAALSR
jgi:hypothetical protein